MWCLLKLPTTENGFAMWWHSVFCLLKFIDKVDYCSFVQHLLVSHHIAKTMLAACTAMTR